MSSFDTVVPTIAGVIPDTLVHRSVRKPNITLVFRELTGHRGEVVEFSDGISSSEPRWLGSDCRNLQSHIAYFAVVAQKQGSGG